MAITSGVMALSTTAAAMPNGPCRYGVHIRNDDGSIVALVGNASAQSYELLAGESVYIQCRNINQVYIKSASGTPNVQYIYN